VVPPESQVCEWKTSFRTHRLSRQRLAKIELASLRTVASFLNADGGSLFIGVNPEGRVVGIGHEWPVGAGSEAREKLQGQVLDSIHQALDPAPIGFLTVGVETTPAGQGYLKIDVRPRPGVTYLRTNPKSGESTDEVYVRDGLRSLKLEGKMRDQFIVERHRHAPLVSPSSPGRSPTAEPD
jgi:predicted HTH transcriptional regulator